MLPCVIREIVAIIETGLIGVAVRTVLKDNPVLLAPPLLALALAILPQAEAPAPSKEAREKVERLIERARRVIDADKDVQSRIFSLNRLASLRARLGERDAARRTYAEAVALGEGVAMDDSRYSPHVLMLTAFSQRNAGLREDAIATLNRLLAVADGPVKMEAVRDSIYRSILRTLAELGDKAGVARVTDRLTKYYEQTRDFDVMGSRTQSLVEARALSGDLEGAFESLDDIRTYGGAGPVEVASQRQSLIFTIVRAISSGNRQGAEAVIRGAVENLEKGEDRGSIEYRIQHRGEIAEAQARIGKFDDAMATASAMQAEPLGEGAPADLVATRVFRTGMAYAAIAEEALKAGDRAHALAAAKRVGGALEMEGPESHKGVARERAVEILAKLGDIDGAIALSGRADPLMRARAPCFGGPGAAGREGRGGRDGDAAGGHRPGRRGPEIDGSESVSPDPSRPVPGDAGRRGGGEGHGPGDPGRFGPQRRLPPHRRRAGVARRPRRGPRVLRRHVLEAVRARAGASPARLHQGPLTLWECGRSAAAFCPND